MDKSSTADITRTETDHQIDWVLSHPEMSDWLKNALKTAQNRDAVALLNDLEILRVLLRSQANAKLAHSRTVGASYRPYLN